MTAAAPLLAPRGGGRLKHHDPRALVIATLLFALITLSLDSLVTAGLALALAVMTVMLAGLTLRELIWRLLVFESLMLVLLLTLPFSVPGDRLFALGPMTATQAGVTLAALIVLKAHAVALAVMGMLSRLEPAVLGHALARLGLPNRLAHLLLLTLRQIALLHQEFSRLRLAMRARGFVARSNRHTWTSYGQLIGMLLVRSLHRARRIEAAMRCRGFRGRFYLLDSSRWRAADTLSLLGLLVMLAGLLALDQST
ncbi:cobalt transport protein CbiQ [Thiorhodovibrio winogradskyi]|uniref:Cobalt transport protein CbiQ n=1 Tax=Thiorhodovibrio winogradskyi TaxID=77007 RepID=A0ABZ0S7A7_9GAMM|nr:cobalt ECF transporter T component CbiQ [Thiorhodovibrio winogradskyi]